jgi:tocopherol cyclase
MRLYRPHVFQGDLTKKNYFEGWYFKLVDATLNLSLCLIPGVSLDGTPHGFIQFADTLTGKSGYVRYDLKDIVFSKAHLDLKLSQQHFSDRQLDIYPTKEMPYRIQLTIEDPETYPVKWYHPGIMGPFRFFPFMECYHGVHVVGSRAIGTVEIEGVKHTLKDARLYIEKDWGTSFPREWVWIEASQFNRDDVRLMLSIANIPWLGRSFNGHLGYVWLGDERIGLGTYRLSHYTLSVEEHGVVIAVNKGDYHIVIEATKRHPVPLVAPSLGDMTRDMEEDLNALVYLSVYKHGELVYEGSSEYAGFETCGEVEELIS